MTQTQDIVEALRAALDESGDPIVTAAEVAEFHSLGKRSVLERLRRAEAAGDVASKEVGARAVVWWPADSQVGGQPTLQESGRVTEGSERRDTLGSRADEGEPYAATIQKDLFEEYRDYLEDEGPQKSHVRDGLVEMLRELRERETMETGELKDVLEGIVGDRYESRKTMWESYNRYAKKLPGFEKSGYGEWSYAGDETLRKEMEGS